MAAKLKVYATRIGFHDAVVAAPNQTAALAAWDIRENLFAQGAAVVSDDAGAIEAATARPGVVLRRAAGSHDPFSEAPAAPKVKAAPRSKTKAARPAPPPDRRALDVAEKALADLAEEERRATEDFARRRTALQQDRDRARRAYERAGG